MSAFANILSSNQIEQSLTEDKLSTGKQTSSGDISDINVITRIDYNLRFAKQAVLVVASETNQYSQIASQYLVSLSSTANNSQINVAFVSASAKLNDIQIRCRLVEQLFVNTLFDPEQSLAVSVLKFAKQHGEAITIVIEHAHALSLQIKYELCQLVDQAKKHNLSVNVVIFGLTEAAYQVSINKSLFKNKIAVIDAESGQVLSLDDNKIKPQKNKVSLTLLQKSTLAAVMLILLMLLLWGYQLIASAIDENNTVSQPSIVTVGDTMLGSSDTNNRTMLKKEKITSENNTSDVEAKVQASSSEISLAILAATDATEEEFVQAEAADVINALTSFEHNDVQSEKATKQAFTENTALINKSQPVKKTINKVNRIDSHYYENQVVVHDKGYVIQIAGFADKQLWQRFIKENRVNNLYSYERLLNGKSFIVVTSKVFPNKAEAKEALSLLPKKLNERKPWLKDISAVITEINTFKD
ncbi:SPOR domain-containing protein [Colwellia sp. E2M01]|uniref:SPOR domain-containing protein n=1 Tax=Colwellia sp. E2M01 TaxID=2841561 RepID=UPI001C0A4CB8|nr:SPOR domain-containing protein [Colwellia sp. E2M01]MBU2870618.1 SPOR domain-containing protein [Colwellia sp. E2M01]